MPTAKIRAVSPNSAASPIVQLAVYDYETAIIADRVGIDILCVSDTGGMVLFGHESPTQLDPGHPAKMHVEHQAVEQGMFPIGEKRLS